MINRIRSIRKAKGWTLADLAEACDPPTTAQTIGRLETGMRSLSLGWMERIAKALETDPKSLFGSEDGAPPMVAAVLTATGPEPLAKPQNAVLPIELAGAAMLTVLTVEAAAGEYRPGDQLWLRHIEPADSAQAINRDVLVPRKGGRFAFGRLIDRRGSLVGILPPGLGQKQQVIDDPSWIAVAVMLVRSL